jgi:hypothetical protein
MTPGEGARVIPDQPRAAYGRQAGPWTAADEGGGGVIPGTVKITPRVAAQVARRLRLAASMRSSSMSRLVNDALDAALPSLEEIRMQLAAPAAAESRALAEMAGHCPAPVTRRRRAAARLAGSCRREARAMATFAEDHGRRWQPFGLSEADWAAVPERNGVRVVNVTPGSGQGPVGRDGGYAVPPSRWACWRRPRRR